MRANEFIVERKMPERKDGPLRAMFQFPKMPSSDPYQAYRFGMAMADHTLTNAVGPTDRNAVVVAYTDEELDIIRGAERQTGHKGVQVADTKSREPTSTGKQSPVARPKRNKYGV